MAAAAQTSEPTNPSTGAERLLAVARWIIAFLFVRCLIFRGKELVAAFRRQPDAFDSALLTRRFGTTDRALILAGIARALHRAAALEATLLATGPIEAMADIDRRRAVAAEIADICIGFGIFRGRPACAIATPMRQRRVSNFWPPVPTSRRSQTSPAIPLLPTGPPPRRRGGFQTRPYQTDIATRVHPWNFSGCAPASFASYGLS